jgi:predicted CoA-binding protein
VRTIFALRELMTTAKHDVPASSDWRSHLIEDDAGIRSLLERTRRIAVLGIKTAHDGMEPAYYVPLYAQKAGYEIVPVPIYYPEVIEILHQPVYRAVADITEPVDMVNVFRRSQKIDAHVDDILKAQPGSVWFQLGIRNDSAAEKFARAGIDVVQNRCLLVELRAIGR